MNAAHIICGIHYGQARQSLRRPAAAARRHRLSLYRHRDDLYPDALPCLQRLRAQGLLVGIVGNQPRAIETALAALDVPADIIGSSASWGVEKPDPAFFARVIAATDGLAPSEIAYVGDRLDNDVLPAIRAGMTGILLRRGPWAMIQADKIDSAMVKHVLYDLSTLPELLEGI